MSQAQGSSEYDANEIGSGISLASVTVGIIAAALFLLISSYLSNDASWNIPSDRAWVSTSLTGNDLSVNTWQVPVTEQLRTKLPQSHNNDAPHFSDALYSADFMNSSPEPT